MKMCYTCRFRNVNLEIAEALNEFADNLKRIEKKYLNQEVVEVLNEFADNLKRIEKKYLNQEDDKED